MKTAGFLDHPALRTSPQITRSLERTLEAFQPAFKHLPVPVRFRATGALRAWQTVLDELADNGAAKAALSTTAVSPRSATQSFVRSLSTQVNIRQGFESMLSPMLWSMASFSSHMLMFWLRNGALYEPTLSLGTLLGGSDVSSDLPLRLLSVPFPTMCIVVPWQQRHHCAKAAAVNVFEHERGHGQALGSRAVTFQALHPSPSGLTTDELVLEIKDEDEPMHAAFEREIAATSRQVAQSGIDGETELAAAEAQWRQVLAYTLKVLLYAGWDQAVVRAQTPYTSAPKEFPGLGRRKREAKLAEVERLYDRYLIGPENLADISAPSEAGRLQPGAELPAHWRRGHFRHQPYGPQAALRKVLFIAPTIVRADKLPSQPG